jgi:hypothetical protein
MRNNFEIEHGKTQLKKMISKVASQNFSINAHTSLLQNSRLEYLLLNKYNRRKLKPTNLKVLEIGCEAGFNLMVLKHYAELYGVDILTRDAWKHALKKTPNFKFLQCNVTKKICHSPTKILTWFY